MHPVRIHKEMLSAPNCAEETYIFHNEILNLRDVWLNLNTLDAVRSNTDLRSLSLQRCKVDPTTLTAFALLTQLQELAWEGPLDKAHNSIVLSAIACLLPLTELSLAHNGLKDEQLEPLSRLTNLAVLDLRVNDLDGSGLIHLIALSQLTSLNALGCDLSSETPFHLLTHLRTLSVSTIERVLPAISTLPNLSQLHCETDIDGLEDCNNLGKLLSLTSLNLSGTHFNIEEPEPFLFLTHLTGLLVLNLLHVHLSKGTQVENLSWAIAKLTNLRKLKLTLGCFNRSIVLHLSEVKALTSLKLNLICQQGEPICSLRALSKLTQLNKLGLVDFRVTKPAIKVLQDLPLFKQLYLQHCTVTPQARPLLRQLPMVEQV